MSNLVDVLKKLTGDPGPAEILSEPGVNIRGDVAQYITMRVRFGFDYYALPSIDPNLTLHDAIMSVDRVCKLAEDWANATRLRIRESHPEMPVSRRPMTEARRQELLALARSSISEAAPLKYKGEMIDPRFERIEQLGAGLLEALG